MNRFVIIIISCLSLSACQLNSKANAPQTSHTEAQKSQAIQDSRTLMAKYAIWQLNSSPMTQAYRGLKSNYDQWDDISQTAQIERHQQRLQFLKQSQQINLEALPRDLALSIKILRHQLTQHIDAFDYRLFNFPVNQMEGLHTQVPSFLTNIHSINTVDDAHAYIDRVYGIKPLFKQLRAELSLREQAGIRPPNFVYQSVIETSENLLSGFPLDRSNTPHILWQDFQQKIKALNLYQSSEKVLTDKLKRALKRAFKPAYQGLVSHLKADMKQASRDTGFHQFADGQAYYQEQLKHATTTNLTAEELHSLGLNEVARLHKEITTLLPKLGHSSLNELFNHTREDPNVFYTDGQQALAQSKHYIRRINQQLQQAFGDIPNIPMVVKAVEHYREQSAPIAFYEPASIDGKRPGQYYMNLSKLRQMPKFQFEALTYHEALPGHHLQIIYAQQSKGLPEFRRHINFTAFTEGWGLYAETLGKELGGYTDPWNDYGRLLMELWRAVRLVLDTGLHAKGWDTQQALQYRLSNTPFSEEDSINAIQRYLVLPGQATTYKVGQLKFLALKQQAKSALGSDFNLAKYHDFILQQGPMPLNILEQEVSHWINR